MAAWRQQALIDAPLEVVWSLVGDPRSFPGDYPPCTPSRTSPESGLAA